MTDDDPRMQPTQPKGKGQPIEIPIPTREAVIRDLMKTAPPVEESDTPDKPSG